MANNKMINEQMNAQFILEKKDDIIALKELKDSAYFNTVINVLSDFESSAITSLVSCGTEDINKANENIATVRVVRRFKRMFENVDKTYDYMVKLEEKDA